MEEIIFCLLLLSPVLAVTRCPPCKCESSSRAEVTKPSARSGQSLAVTDDLFITIHPSQIPRFQKYFRPQDSFQPLQGIFHSEDDHSHEFNASPAEDWTQCPQKPNYLNKYLVSNLKAPNCPLMDVDEAISFCTQRNAMLVSNILSPNNEALAIASFAGSFWTNGFIGAAHPNEVAWNDHLHPINRNVWAEGQPDGPTFGVSSESQNCVSVNPRGKLQDSRCSEKLAVVCEIMNLTPNLDFMMQMQ